MLSVIPADDEQDAVRIANDTIYGLNSSVFTPDVDRARRGRRPDPRRHRRSQRLQDRLRMAFGGFKQSGIGREGGKEGLLPFLETKTVILDEAPTGYTTAD